MRNRDLTNGRRVVLVAAMLAAAAWCAAAMAQGGGSITGTVKNRWVSRFPIVVCIEDVPGKKFPPPARHPHMDQKGKVFIPRVLPVVVGTTVDFLNSDPFEHNVYSPDNEKYNLGKWGKGKVRSYTFKRTGVYAQLCKIHPEMAAFIVVMKNPYFAVTDSQGRFTIKNVPPGSYKLKVWGERLRPKQLEKSFDVQVTAGGTATVTIEP